MDDDVLMQELLGALLDDTSKHIRLLDAAIRERDRDGTLRLAHSCKGACANLGANAVAATLHRLEQEAARDSFDECTLTAATLAREFERLSAAVSAVTY